MPTKGFGGTAGAPEGHEQPHHRHPDHHLAPQHGPRTARSLNRAEVAALLTPDPRTIDHAIVDDTIPAVHVGDGC